MPRILLALLLVLSSVGAVCAAPIDWDPGRTWVFSVGVLEFKSKGTYASFPKSYREDAVFVDLLRRQGVPADHMTFLKDRAATRQAIESSFLSLLQKTSPGDFLIFYYCGHGGPGKTGKVMFTPYDADGTDESGWTVASIFQNLETHFKGDRVLLTADCCYSGAMARQVKMHAGSRISYASLTSSNARQISTGAWTFTEALVDGLSGNPCVDLNHDGKITLQEMASFTEDEMVFADDQLSAFASEGALKPTSVMALTRGTQSGRVGQRLEAENAGVWYRCKVVAEKEGRCKVHYYGYDPTQDEWVPPTRLRPLKPVALRAAGSHVQVEWEGDYYPATIKRVHRGVYLIHYDDFDETWDEWTGPSRIK